VVQYDVLYLNSAAFTAAATHNHGIPHTKPNLQPLTKNVQKPPSNKLCIFDLGAAAYLSLVSTHAVHYRVWEGTSEQMVQLLWRCRCSSGQPYTGSNPNHLWHIEQRSLLCHQHQASLPCYPTPTKTHSCSACRYDTHSSNVMQQLGCLTGRHRTTQPSWQTHQGAAAAVACQDS
jgi:hypothetical protein